MALTIQERFQVQAPADRVWAFLIDPARVVRCLPGAELLEAEDERTFRGRIRVKVGPVTGSYQGRATFEEIDEADRRVRMTGSGREKSGGGSARVNMSSRVLDTGDGAAEVRVDVELEVVGKLVQFGRGMIEQVSRQMFQQFASCVQERLAAPAGEEPDAGDGDDDAEATPVALIPVVWHAVRDAVARLFGRAPTS